MDPRPVNLEAPQGSEERVNGRQGLVAFRMVEPVAVTIVRHWDGTLQRARAEQDADGNPL